MNFSEIRSRIQDILQDANGVRWSTTLIDRNINDAYREFVNLSKLPRATAKVPLSRNKAIYSKPESIGEIISCKISGTTATDRDLLIFTDSEINSKSYSTRGYSVGTATVEKVLPFFQSGQFVDPQTSHDWRNERGASRGIVIDSRSDKVFRVYPVPAETNAYDKDLYFVDSSQVVKEFQSLPLTDVGGYSVFENYGVGSVRSGNANGEVVVGAKNTKEQRQATSTSGSAILTDVDNARSLNKNLYVHGVNLSGILQVVEIIDDDRIRLSGNATTSGSFTANFSAGETTSARGIFSSGRRYASVVITGVKIPNLLSSDTDTPIIDEQYHEALVWGGLERSYLIENELRNVQKSGLYRNKFLQEVGKITGREHVNSASIAEGVNQPTMKTARRSR